MTGGRRVRGATRRLRALGAFAVAVLLAPLALAGCTTPAAPGQPGGLTAPRKTSAERVAAYATTGSRR
ncbi:hypothetical protein E3T33_09015 [Cryobacterium sp. TMT1-2-1]|uniref:hypothetical protein n=1 Tax=Cryobacterium sp. TMT1-2-1 TaxID=1259232 RepID=UPI00106C0CD1|nr:hypothetical protein [Cryobacterium sp. TMT1-2-1]TFD44406.1 hypothetical protein E3T33_09015 [Cryobacterium sp. TMT1-2-1]